MVLSCNRNGILANRSGLSLEKVIRAVGVTSKKRKKYFLIRVESLLERELRKFLFCCYFLKNKIERRDDLIWRADILDCEVEKSVRGIQIVFLRCSSSRISYPEFMAATFLELLATSFLDF